MFWECKLNNEEIEPGILSKYVHRLIQERKKPVYFLVKYLQSRLINYQFHQCCFPTLKSAYKRFAQSISHKTTSEVFSRCSLGVRAEKIRKDEKFGPCFPGAFDILSSAPFWRRR